MSQRDRIRHMKLILESISVRESMATQEEFPSPWGRDPDTDADPSLPNRWAGYSDDDIVAICQGER